LQAATTIWGYWLGLCWIAWGILWLGFFILLVMQKPIAKYVGPSRSSRDFCGLASGYLLLNGFLK
jgi:hypothetical protein